jgi:hypothetical protein
MVHGRLVKSRFKASLHGISCFNVKVVQARESREWQLNGSCFHANVSPHMPCRYFISGKSSLFYSFFFF